MSLEKNNNESRQLPVFFVGPLPPPVHGFSEISRRMLVRLQSSTIVEVFDVSPRGGWIYLLRLFIKFVFAAFRDRGGALYLPLSGGFRQFIDMCFAGVALLFGLRVFVHHHSFAYLNRKPFHASLVLWLLRNAVHIVLCEHMGDLLRSQYWISSNKIRVISNAAYLNEAKRLNQSSIYNGKLVLGFLSNITAAKGCFDFIQLLKAAHEQGLAVEGIMAGPVQDEIKDAFKDALRNACSVKHIGAVYGEEKDKFFSKIDLLIFPTRYANEAEPLTIWESMSFGVPVISLSRGCISDIVEKEVGWIIHDPDRFVDEGLDKIRYLLANDLALDAMKAAARNQFEGAKQRYTNNLDALVAEIVDRKI